MNDDITGKLSSLMFSTGQLIREKVRAHIHCHHQIKVEGFTMLHAETLRFIHQQKKVTMRNLADYLHITPPSTTTLIDNLTKTKLIKRINDPNDRRLVHLSLTPKGQKLLLEKTRAIARIMHENLSALTSQDKKNLIQILEKISNKVSLQN